MPASTGLRRPSTRIPSCTRTLQAWKQREGIDTLIADGEGQASPTLMDMAAQGLVDVVQYDIFSPGLMAWLDIGGRLDPIGVTSSPASLRTGPRQLPDRPFGCRPRTFRLRGVGCGGYAGPARTLHRQGRMDSPAGDPGVRPGSRCRPFRGDGPGTRLERSPELTGAWETDPDESGRPARRAFRGTVSVSLHRSGSIGTPVGRTSAVCAHRSHGDGHWMQGVSGPA